jgi:hypothetical protein
MYAIGFEVALGSHFIHMMNNRKSIAKATAAVAATLPPKRRAG